MPIYDFQCSSCGFKDEVMRKSSAANIEPCPKCGAETFTKQLSAPSFQLSGSGWYATDFKNGPNKGTSNTVSSSKSEGAKSGATPEGKSGEAKAGETKSGEKKPDAAPAACSTGCSCH